jgi:hypothetical protein
MLKDLLNKGKCKLGFHAGEWGYIASLNCAQLRVCERCGAESRRTEHSWPEWTYLNPKSCTLARNCLRCQQEETKVAHAWGDWAYIHRYSCIQRRGCTRCGHIDDQTQTTHQWAQWEFSDHYAGPVQVCTRCGELNRPGASGGNPSDDELTLVVEKLVAADSQEQITRLLHTNQQALFSKNATRFLQRCQQDFSHRPKAKERIANLEMIIDSCRKVGIDAALQQPTVSSYTPSAQLAAQSASPGSRAAQRVSSKIDPSLVGRWRNTRYEGGPTAILYAYDVDLDEDGTFTQSESAAYAGSSYGSTGMRETGRGQWELNQGLLLLNYTNGNQVACRYQVQGTKLYCQFTNGVTQEWERA